LPEKEADSSPARFAALGFFVRGPQLSHLLALSNWLRAHTYHIPTHPQS
jgi:hypothetical protein